MRVGLPVAAVLVSLCDGCSGTTKDRPAAGGYAHDVGTPGVDAEVAAADASAMAPDARADAGAPSRSHGPRCRAGCTSPSCTPPFDQCAQDYPSPPGLKGPTGHNPVCVHVARFSADELELLCEPVDGDTFAAEPLNPPVNCALDSGLVDAAEPNGTSVEQCTVNYQTCLPPRFGAPGWLCCTEAFAFAEGGLAALRYECIAPDGGPLPVWYPPPISESAADF